MKNMNYVLHLIFVFVLTLRISELFFSVRKNRACATLDIHTNHSFLPREREREKERERERERERDMNLPQFFCFYH